MVVAARSGGVDDLTIGKDPANGQKSILAGGRRDARSPSGDATADRSRSRVPCFWTFSVGVDSSSLDAFGRSEPHRRIITGAPATHGETPVRVLPDNGSRTPMAWEHMKAPLHPR